MKIPNFASSYQVGSALWSSSDQSGGDELEEEEDDTVTKSKKIAENTRGTVPLEEILERNILEKGRIQNEPLASIV